MSNERCPNCGGTLTRQVEVTPDGEIVALLWCMECETEYPDGRFISFDD